MIEMANIFNIAPDNVSLFGKVLRSILGFEKSFEKYFGF
jgi:hypothetical protein